MAKTVTVKKVKTPMAKMPPPEPTPTAPAADATTAAAKATVKASKATRNLSVDVIPMPGGARRAHIAEYQDWTFSVNADASRMLTDEELCKDWQRQFPNAVHYHPTHVKGARRDYNRGIHSKTFNSRPPVPSVEYVKGADGKSAPLTADTVDKAKTTVKAAKKAASQPTKAA